MSLAGDSSLFTKANPQSTSCTLKAKSNKAPECHAICSKALRFMKIVQDKKYISKNKERDVGRMPSRIKKKCKDKACKNNIVHVGDDDHSCSISQEDSDDDESTSMFSLGSSLGITLNEKPVRSKNDTFSDFLLEEAFKILEDKALLKLDFSDDSHNNPKPKTIVSFGRSNIIPDHELLTEKFEALSTKINSEFLKKGEELKEM
ncbi:hypothetical protein Tco_1245251 [Tanacetum coccineum]